MPSLERRGAAPSPISVSRSSGSLVVAFSKVGPVGVDIEAVRPVATAAVLRVAAAPGEARDVWLDASPERVLAWWCGKEAVLKSLGTGLRGDPRAFISGVPWRARESPVIGVDGGRTIPARSLRRLAVGTAHVAVVATEPGARLALLLCRGGGAPGHTAKSRQLSYTCV